MNIKIKIPNNDDIHQIVKIHKLFFKEGLISSFPDELVFKIYRDIANSTDSFCYVTVDGNTVVGYVSGAKDFNQFLKKFILKNLFKMLPYLLTRIFEKSFLLRCLNILTHSKEKVEGSDIKAELLSIAVLTEYQGQGIAKELFNSLCQSFYKEKIDKFKILVGSSLSESIIFYEKVGAVKVFESEWHNNESAWIFVKNTD